MTKIKNVDANYTRDMAVLAGTYLLIERCPGGRPINKGCICPHCGTDTSHGDCNGVDGFVNETVEPLDTSKALTIVDVVTLYEAGDAGLLQGSDGHLSTVARLCLDWMKAHGHDPKPMGK